MHHHGVFHRGAPGLPRAQLQGGVAVGQQLLHVLQGQGLEHLRIAEHRTDLRMGLIADAAQQIGGTVGIGLAEILKVVQVQHQAPGPLRLRIGQQVPQHPWAIENQRTRWC
ncbi:MAG: hypothetical protein KFB97_01190 [Cyanobium sp. M30B3]|nr:MAG: hypothetical protein KFB97_01190 [Cyanobium sp. M30B3]